MAERHCVTGAFGYSGRAIARRLLAAGHMVRTLTGSPERPHDLPGPVEVRPLAFDDPAGLERALDGVAVLYNTYWVRYPRAGCSHAAAVAHTERLFAAARAAGVRRIVHVSVTNPSPTSRYSYFRGKWALEAALRASGVPHTILRPAVFFGGTDILVNNIAWVLRTFPVFGCFGSGDYRLQPIHLDDFAALAVRAGQDTGDAVVEAIGPETYTFRALVRTIGVAIDAPRPIVAVPRWAGRLAAGLIGWWQRDVLLTAAEIGALMDGLLAVDAPAAGPTRLSEWLATVGDTLGRRYAHELDRRRDRRRAYAPGQASGSGP